MADGQQQHDPIPSDDTDDVTTATPWGAIDEPSCAITETPVDAASPEPAAVALQIPADAPPAVEGSGTLEEPASAAAAPQVVYALDLSDGALAEPSPLERPEPVVAVAEVLAEQPDDEVTLVLSREEDFAPASDSQDAAVPMPPADTSTEVIAAAEPVEPTPASPPLVEACTEFIPPCNEVSGPLISIAEREALTACDAAAEASQPELFPAEALDAPVSTEVPALVIDGIALEIAIAPAPAGEHPIEVDFGSDDPEELCTRALIAAAPAPEDNADVEAAAEDHDNDDDNEADQDQANQPVAEDEEDDEPEPEPLLEEEQDLEAVGAGAADGSGSSGGGWTFVSLCLGVAIIGCAVLIPQADFNRRLVHERETLRRDLASIEQQVKVNDAFLKKVADDPSLAERLAQRQMKIIRKGSRVLELRDDAPPDEMSPYHLVAVPPPAPLPAYRAKGGFIASLTYHPKSRLYMLGAGLMLMAAGLVFGAVPRRD